MHTQPSNRDAHPAAAERRSSASTCGGERMVINSKSMSAANHQDSQQCFSINDQPRQRQDQRSRPPARPPPNPKTHLTPWWHSTTVCLAMSRSSEMVSDQLQVRAMGGVRCGRVRPRRWGFGRSSGHRLSVGNSTRTQPQPKTAAPTAPRLTWPLG